VVNWGLGVCCIALAVSGSGAEPQQTETKTNTATIAYLPWWTQAGPTEPTEAVRENFSAGLLNSDSFEFDRFQGPASQLNWVRRFNAQGYGAIEHFNSSGARMFQSLASDSLRDATAAALPSEYWEDVWTGLLGKSIAGTIGDAEEEGLDYTSISYSATRRSWESSHRDAGFNWGFRPWRTNPYLYFLAHAGHLERRPLLTLEGRSGYTLFGSSKVEGRLALALPSAFQLSGAASFDPVKMHGDYHGSPHFSVTLERAVHLSRNAIPSTLFFVGFRAGKTSLFGDSRQETLFLTGFYRTW
jgi:hypothetical protein